MYKKTPQREWELIYKDKYNLNYPWNIPKSLNIDPKAYK